MMAMRVVTAFVLTCTVAIKRASGHRRRGDAQSVFLSIVVAPGSAPKFMEFVPVDISASLVNLVGDHKECPALTDPETYCFPKHFLRVLVVSPVVPPIE